MIIDTGFQPDFWKKFKGSWQLLLALLISLGAIGCKGNSQNLSPLQNDPAVVAQPKEISELKSSQVKKAVRLYDLAASDLQEALGDARALRRKTTNNALKSSLDDVIDSLETAGSEFAECTTGAPLLDGSDKLLEANADKAIADSNNAINNLDEAGGELDDYTGTLDPKEEVILDDLLGSIDDTADDLTDATLRLGAKMS